MANLTLEQLKKELRDQDGRLDKKLKEQEVRIGKKIEEEVGGLAAMTSRGFEEIKKELDVRTRVSSLERDMQKIKVALHIS